MEHHKHGYAGVGDVAPDFTLPTLKGELFSLHALRSQWVVLFTWASW